MNKNKIIYSTLIILTGGCLQSSWVSACHDYSDAPKDYLSAYHNGQDYGYLGSGYDWESYPDYQEDGKDTDGDGIDGDKYDDGLSAATLSDYTWIVTPGENALLTFTARQLTCTPRFNYVKIWIDWNKNKDWADNERVIRWEGWVPEKGKSISVNCNVPVPIDFTGETWLRARISSSYGCFTPYTSYSSFTGEVEDYKVVAASPTPPVIPEPHTLLLLGSGLIGLTGRYLKKKRM